MPLGVPAEGGTTVPWGGPGRGSAARGGRGSTGVAFGRAHSTMTGPKAGVSWQGGLCAHPPLAACHPASAPGPAVADSGSTSSQGRKETQFKTKKTVPKTQISN